LVFSVTSKAVVDGSASIYEHNPLTSRRCELGKYYDDFDEICIGCVECSTYNREEATPCGEERNTQCGGCLPGFMKVSDVREDLNIMYKCTPRPEPETPAEPREIMEKPGAHALSGVEIIVLVLGMTTLVTAMAGFLYRRRRQSQLRGRQDLVPDTGNAYQEVTTIPIEETMPNLSIDPLPIEETTPPVSVLNIHTTVV